MLRALSLLAAAFSLATVGGASDSGSDPIRVHVRQADAGGFAEPGVADSVKDLMKILKGKKILTLVPTAEEADVVLEVVSRDKEFRGASTATATTDRSTGQTDVDSTPQQSPVVYARLIAGDYTKNLEGMPGKNTLAVGGPWTMAAKSIANQTETWIKLNEAQLRRRRR